MRPHLRTSVRRLAWAAVILVLAGPAMAAPGSGTAVITPSSDVTAGSGGTWTIRYTAADTFITGTIEIAIPIGWSAPQLADPHTAGYVTVSTAGTLGAPELSIAGRIITVNIAALDTSQTVDVVYGDASVDALGRAVAQTAAASNVEFTVGSDPSGASPLSLASSPRLNVVAGPIEQLLFLTPQRTLTADGESAVMRVATEDAFGNHAPVGGVQNVNLGSSAGTGRFSHLGGTNFVATGAVTIAAGEDTVSFYYRDTAAGNKTITASGAGQSWTPAQQSVTVQAGTPFRLKVFPADTTITAGDFARFRLRVEDADGNPSPPQNSQTITLLGQPGSFYTTSNHTTPITQIVVPSGSSTVYLDYQNTIKEMTVPYVLAWLDQDGVLPTLEAASANVFVANAAFNPGTSDISVDKPSAVANGVDSIKVTVRVSDLYGNGVAGATVVIASSGSGNTLRQPVGTTGSSGTVVGAVKSTKAELKTLTAKVDGVDIAASAEATFIAGSFSPGMSDVSNSPSTVVANGVDSTVVTVTVRDAQGNPIAGSAVVIGSTGGPNSIRQ
ncbi:MAG TPA: invasin domain 3-containing protein, partial [Candidatus Bathyarchaeia archaeon]|nr:invasin domain 3-containing protein [Candidatus Bathyarchaeia archaeon]